MTFEEALPLVKLVCNRYAGRRRYVDRDELVNEIFLRCNFDKFTSHKGQGLGRYIEYRLIDYFRHNFGRPIFKSTVARNQTVTSGSMDLNPTRDGPNSVDDADEYDWLTRGLKLIDRQILHLYYRRGLTMREIAGIVGCNESYISTRHKATLAYLRRKAG